MTRWDYEPRACPRRHGSITSTSQVQCRGYLGLLGAAEVAPLVTGGRNQSDYLRPLHMLHPLISCPPTPAMLPYCHGDSRSGFADLAVGQRAETVPLRPPRGHTRGDSAIGQWLLSSAGFMLGQLATALPSDDTFPRAVTRQASSHVYVPSHYLDAPHPGGLCDLVLAFNLDDALDSF